jgi:hypothetical protein
MVRHMVTESLGHNLIDLFRKPQVVGVHRDYMLPPRTGVGEGSLYISESLSDLIRKWFGGMPIVIPVALARGLDPVTDLDRLRVMKRSQLTLP